MRVRVRHVSQAFIFARSVEIRGKSVSQHFLLHLERDQAGREGEALFGQISTLTKRRAEDGH